MDEDMISQPCALCKELVPLARTYRDICPTCVRRLADAMLVLQGHLMDIQTTGIRLADFAAAVTPKKGPPPTITPIRDIKESEKPEPKTGIQKVSTTDGHKYVVYKDVSEPSQYRLLEKGEIIKEGDEIQKGKQWVPVINTIGTPAPDPGFTSHRMYRRKVQSRQEAFVCADCACACDPKELQDGVCIACWRDHATRKAHTVGGQLALHTSEVPGWEEWHDQVVNALGHGIGVPKDYRREFTHKGVTYYDTWLARVDVDRSIITLHYNYSEPNH